MFSARGDFTASKSTDRVKVRTIVSPASLGQHWPRDTLLCGLRAMSAGWLLLYLFGLYVLAGLVFGLTFVMRGVTQVLDHTAGVSPGARILLLPASIALWPIILRRWLKVRSRP